MVISYNFFAVSVYIKNTYGKKGNWNLSYSLTLPFGVSEAQSAVVNDSSANCQSRRPGAPQSTGDREAVGEVLLK